MWLILTWLYTLHLMISLNGYQWHLSFVKVKGIPLNAFSIPMDRSVFSLAWMLSQFCLWHDEIRIESLPMTILIARNFKYSRQQHCSMHRWFHMWYSIHLNFCLCCHVIWSHEMHMTTVFEKSNHIEMFVLLFTHTHTHTYALYYTC